MGKITMNYYEEYRKAFNILEAKLLAIVLRLGFTGGREIYIGTEELQIDMWPNSNSNLSDVECLASILQDPHYTYEGTKDNIKYATFMIHPDVSDGVFTTINAILEMDDEAFELWRILR